MNGSFRGRRAKLNQLETDYLIVLLALLSVAIFDHGSDETVNIYFIIHACI